MSQIFNYQHLEVLTRRWNRNKAVFTSFIHLCWTNTEQINPQPCILFNSRQAFCWVLFHFILTCCVAYFCLLVPKVVFEIHLDSNGYQSVLMCLLKNLRLNCSLWETKEKKCPWVWSVLKWNQMHVLMTDITAELQLKHRCALGRSHTFTCDWTHPHKNTPHPKAGAVISVFTQGVRKPGYLWEKALREMKKAKRALLNGAHHQLHHTQRRPLLLNDEDWWSKWRWGQRS